MLNLIELNRQTWFQRLPHRVKRLLEQTVILVERESALVEGQNFFDYGFLVFSAAKSYEGYLKEFFLDNNLISLEVYQDEHFRIGRALNPDMPKRYRDENWLFDDVSQLCGQALAIQLWDAWKQCRNEVFHYTFTEVGHLSYEEAASRVERVMQAMQAAEKCELANGRKSRKVNN